MKCVLAHFYGSVAALAALG